MFSRWLSCWLPGLGEHQGTGVNSGSPLEGAAPLNSEEPGTHGAFPHRVPAQRVSLGGLRDSLLSPPLPGRSEQCSQLETGFVSEGGVCGCDRPQNELEWSSKEEKCHLCLGPVPGSELVNEAAPFSWSSEETRKWNTCLPRSFGVASTPFLGEVVEGEGDCAEAAREKVLRGQAWRCGCCPSLSFLHETHGRSQLLRKQRTVCSKGPACLCLGDPGLRPPGSLLSPPALALHCTCSHSFNRGTRLHPRARPQCRSSPSLGGATLPAAPRMQGGGKA